jgi:predicted dehydrogenase
VIPAIQQSRNGRVAAIARRDEKKARKVAGSLQIPTPIGDYQKLLDSDEIEVVYIPLPNSMHHKWTMLAAESGKHVLCEKPLALNLREAQEMVSACQKAGVQLLEGFMYRHYLHIQQLLTLMNQRTIGEVSVVRSEFTFPLDDPTDIRLQKQLGGGALYDVGCYCVDCSRLITKSEPIKVQAAAEYAKDRVDYALTGLIQFQNKQIAIFDCGLKTMLRHTVELLGEKGTITLTDAFEPGCQAQITLRTKEKSEVIQCQQSNPYHLMAEHFVDTILTGKAPMYTTKDSLTNMKLLDALYESAARDS